MAARLGPDAGARLRARACGFLALLRSNGFQVGLGDDEKPPAVDLQPFGAQLYLTYRFLAGDVDDAAAVAGEGRRGLQ